MITIRLIKRDIQNLLMRSRAVLLWISLIFLASIWLYETNHSSEAITLAGCMKTAFDGCFPFQMGIASRFQLPITWFVLTYLICYSTAAYNSQEMGTRVQTILHSSSRTRWWFSKCAALLVWTTLCYLVGIVVLIIALSIKGVPIFSAHLEQPLIELLAPFLLPLLNSFVLAVMQFCVTILFSYIASQILLLSVLILSAFFDCPFLGVPYSMSIRNAQNLTGTLHTGDGILLFLFLLIVFIIGGWLLFCKTDIYQKK